MTRRGVGSDRKQLSDPRQEDLHIFAVGFREFRASGLILFERKSIHVCSLDEQSTLQIPHMSFREVLIFTDEHDRRQPELLSLILRDPFSDDFRLADVRARHIRDRVIADKNR